MALFTLTEAERERRRQRSAQIAAARASKVAAPPPTDPSKPPSLTVWRGRDLPEPRTGMVGVPLAEGVTSVFAGSVLYIPIALFTQYARRNYVVAALAVVLLSYAL